MKIMKDIELMVKIHDDIDDNKSTGNSDVGEKMFKYNDSFN